MLIAKFVKPVPALQFALVLLGFPKPPAFRMQPSDRSIQSDNFLRLIGRRVAAHSSATLCAKGFWGRLKGIRAIRGIRIVAGTKLGMRGCRG